jgi:hypothetical protein
MTNKFRNLGGRVTPLPDESGVPKRADWFGTPDLSGRVTHPVRGESDDPWLFSE